MPAQSARRSFPVSSIRNGQPVHSGPNGQPDSAVRDVAAEASRDGDGGMAGVGADGFRIGRTAAPIRIPIRVRTQQRRWAATPFILLGIFLLLNIVGGVLLALPVAAADGSATSLQTGFFTAISAATVTGLTQVDTQTHWSFFGQVVIFLLMLIGGLEFITAATVLIALMGRRASSLEEDVYQDTIGQGYRNNIGQLVRNIVIAFGIGYLIGAALIFVRMREVADFTLLEAVWQSLFLSVSALNNAGFSILPNSAGGGNAATLGAEPYIIGVLIPLIILGALGWPLIVDLRKNWTLRPTAPRTWLRREAGLAGILPFNFVRLTLDSKLVLLLTTALYLLSTGAFMVAEWRGVLLGHSLPDKLEEAIFHGVSGRTAGFAALDWSATTEFTNLLFIALMFVGGSTASVSGGIKVNTLAVLLAAARSSALRQPRTEIFRRQIGAALVARALLVTMAGTSYLGLVVPILTFTENHPPFIPLLFEVVSAFGTNGMSSGLSAHLSRAGSIIFMVTMLVGRIGPLTLVMLLAPRDEISYRYPEEPVRIG